MPTGMEIDSVVERQPVAPSVISPTHPQNIRQGHEGRCARSYTFRQHKTKLKFTLGWELEATHTPNRIPAGIELINDNSVDGDGSEFVVMPAITKSPQYVLGLLKDLVHTPNLNTNKSCGFHVHVSASNLTLPRLRQWAIATEYLAVQIEDLAFKAVPDSRGDNRYCKRIKPIRNGDAFVSNKYSNARRYNWLNTVEMFRPNGIRTIENRLLGNTHRWKYVLAWSLFTMELARRGWEVSNEPFDIADHVANLSDILRKIEEEVKPLDRKFDPVPQWVYMGLSSFGIHSTVWDRPLATLSETEAEVCGLSIPTYSDNQPELPCQDDSCVCGCGEEGRCVEQTHADADCERSYCRVCHNEGNCDNLPNCSYCVSRAHRSGISCQRPACSRCTPHRAVMPSYDGSSIVPRTGAGLFDNIVNLGLTPISLESIQRAASVVAVDGGPASVYNRLLSERMTPNGTVQSNNRAIDYIHAESMMTYAEAYDSQLRRASRTRGCAIGCMSDHGNTDCLICGRD